MTIHRIRLLGDPILRARCELIEKPGSTAIRVILDDMRETLRDWQGRFGSGRAIAAPQIGAPVRMVYAEMDKPWVLINPEIVERPNRIGIDTGAFASGCLTALVLEGDARQFLSTGGAEGRA